jgi:hypothetical protein
MNKQQQEEIFDKLTKLKRETLLSKGDDYANQDRLSNFKLAGAVTGMDAKKNCLALIGTKVARLGNLLHGKEPKNEAVIDSVLDLSNYADLLYMILIEEQGALPEILPCDHPLCSSSTITVELEEGSFILPPDPPLKYDFKDYKGPN